MVYKGTLDELGKSETIVTDRGYWTSHLGMTRYHKQGDSQENWWKFSYITVGGEKIRSVMVRPAWEDYLREALGQEIELSIGGDPNKPLKRHTLLAMRTLEAGLLREGASVRVVGNFLLLIRTLFVALILGVLVTLPAWIGGFIIGAILGSSGNGAIAGFAIGLLSIPVFIFFSLRTIVRTNRQRMALG